MTQLGSNPIWILTFGAILVVGGLFYLGKTNLSYADPPNVPASPEKHLFIWAGDQARKNADFLAVVNFDESSTSYGKVVTTSRFPELERPGMNRIMWDCPSMGAYWPAVDS